MQSPKNSNFKIYIFIAICMVVIIGMWLYTLKLNLSKPSKSTFDWSEIFGGWGDAVKDVPPMPELTTTTPEVSDELINELADKLKDDTKDWEVHRNEEMGFEFKYPKEWVLDNDLLSPWPIEKYMIGSNNAPIHFGVYSEDQKIFLNNDDIYDYNKIKYYLANNQRNNPDLVLNINNYRFEKYDLIDFGRYEGDSAGNVIIYGSKNFLNNEKNLYIIFEWQEKPGNEVIDLNSSKYLDSIISTFKFI